MHREIQHEVHLQMYTGCTVVATFTAQGHDVQFIYIRILTELTRRNEGELDCIALDEVPQYCICTLDEVSIKSSYTVNTSDCCGMFCRSLNSVLCTKKGSAKGFTTLKCPIVYPHWGCPFITVSTDEGELV